MRRIKGIVPIIGEDLCEMSVERDIDEGWESPSWMLVLLDAPSVCVDSYL